MGATSSFSRRTWTVLFLGIASALIVQMLVIAQVGGEAVSTAISDFGGVLIIGTSAIVTIRTALRFGKGEPLRGSGSQSVWACCATRRGRGVDVHRSHPRGRGAYPGVPDLLYVSLYVFLGFGIVSAAVAYRGLVRIKRR